MNTSGFQLKFPDIKSTTLNITALLGSIQWRLVTFWSGGAVLLNKYILIYL